MRLFWSDRQVEAVIKQRLAYACVRACVRVCVSLIMGFVRINAAFIVEA